jgi:hypothetical protein
VADDLGIDLKDFFHNSFGFGNRTSKSQNGTKFIAGASGWARTELGRSDFGSWTGKVLPYGHGAVGLDTVEAGVGLMLALQPPDETTNLALLLPKNGAYAPVFGGDGIGIFGGVRAIAYEGLYEGHAEHFMAEAGAVAQATFFDFLRVGTSGSCTTPAYDTTDKADCKLSFQMGGLF